MTKLRPLTDAEQRAAELMRANRDAGAVAKLTGLSRAQVAAAVDLAEQWDAVFARMNGGVPADAGHGADAVDAAPETDDTTVETEGGTDLQPEDDVDGPEPDSGEPVDPDAKHPSPDKAAVWTDITDEVTAPFETVRGRMHEDEPVADEGDTAEDEEAASDGDAPGVADIADLLERAMQSENLRAHGLARTIYRHLGEIEALLAQEQQAGPLRDAIARLKAELAEKENALDAIYGPAPVSSAVVRRPAAKPFDRKLYYSGEVREWARANDLKVGDKGQISKEVVEAYVAAHAEPAGV